MTPTADAQSHPANGPIATVNGHPIPRHRIVNLLLRAHGPGMLEQIVVLDEAERLAAELGLRVTQADVGREYEEALRKLVDPLGIEHAHDGARFDQATAERTLEAILIERNISREEFMEGMRRHAYLRAIVQVRQEFSEDDLRTEFRRVYGPQIQVRHIQLATPRDAERIKGELAAGASFASLARQHSANLVTAETDGLLDPFSQEDEALPELFRRTADGLEPGEVSGPVRIGEWYHLIQLERRIDARPAAFAEVRGELKRSLSQRLTEPAMQELYERLFREAEIEIHDPILREAFDMAFEPRPAAAGD